jgi:hypothetical protein
MGCSLWAGKVFEAVGFYRAGSHLWAKSLPSGREGEARGVVWGSEYHLYPKGSYSMHTRAGPQPASQSTLQEREVKVKQVTTAWSSQ